MKNIIIIIYIFGVLLFFKNSNFNDCNNYLNKITNQNSFSLNYSQAKDNPDFLNDNKLHHKLDNKFINDLNIEIVYVDYYYKIYSLINNHTTQIFSRAHDITFHTKNNYHFKIFFPILTQSQKSIQSAFLLI